MPLLRSEAPCCIPGPAGRTRREGPASVRRSTATALRCFADRPSGSARYRAGLPVLKYEVREVTVIEMDGFREPFIGYLPGLAAITGDLGSSPWGSGIHTYTELLAAQWRRLIDSDESTDERLLQSFLERHPSLLPGSHTVDHSSGHWPFPFAVISQPKLPGLATRIPDFMWIASDSASVYPILIEIETPHKRWFHAKGSEFHSDFHHAHGQLQQWAAWFSHGTNTAAFMDYYCFPDYLRELAFQPRFVLILYMAAGKNMYTTRHQGDDCPGGQAKRAANVV